MDSRLKFSFPRVFFLKMKMDFGNKILKLERREFELKWQWKMKEIWSDFNDKQNNWF